MTAASPSTVLVTGAGGAATSSLIEGLAARGYRVLAADMDPQAAGFYVADKGFVVPAGSSPLFLPVLRAICRGEGVRALVPLVDEELTAGLELEQDGVAVLLPRREFVVTCLDKLALMRRLSAAGVAVPETRLASDPGEARRFPAVVKPRTARGSRGLGIVNSVSELRAFVKASAYPADQLLVQSYIDGVEFTVSVVAWRDGKVHAVVPKEIILKQGITRLAVTRRHPRIESLCRRIQEGLRADGPFNVQLRIDALTGEPVVFEINPRFSTTISLTIAAGVDELGVLLASAIEGKDPPSLDGWREDVVLVRRTSDLFMEGPVFRSRCIVNSKSLG